MTSRKEQIVAAQWILRRLIIAAVEAMIDTDVIRTTEELQDCLHEVFESCAGLKVEVDDGP